MTRGLTFSITIGKNVILSSKLPEGGFTMFPVKILPKYTKD